MIPTDLAELFCGIGETPFLHHPREMSLRVALHLYPYLAKVEQTHRVLSNETRILGTYILTDMPRG